MEKFVDKVMAAFDDIVDSGSDDDLFVSGYLSGHFSLAVSEVDIAGNLSVEAIDSQLKQNLTQAFNEDELEAHDQKKVWLMWEQVKNKSME